MPRDLQAHEALIIALLALILALAVACGGDGGDRTGIPEVDGIIDAVLSEDADTLIDLVVYEQVKCGDENGLDSPFPPHCPPGQPEGTLTAALSSGVCKALFVARHEVPEWVRSLLVQTDLVVYAVYRSESVPDLDGDYTIVFNSASPQEAPPGIQTVSIAEGHILSLTSSCGSLEQLIQSLEESGAVAVLPSSAPD